MSWEQLVDLMQEAALERQQNDARPPSACPHDGQPLLSGPDGVLFCPSDGWRDPGTRPAW